MTIRDLSLRYEGTDHSRETLALSGVNLDIMEGDFVCVLGPSGCGKSTLLNIMAGLLQATEGTIEMLGEPVTGVDWKRAVVFQTPTLYPWLDVYKNVAFGPDVRGIDKKEAEDRAKTYLNLVGLADFAHARPYELSGGMRQRVALARALVNDPKMLLMDEPFGALDAFTRNTMQDLIRKMRLRQSQLSPGPQAVSGGQQRIREVIRVTVTVQDQVRVKKGRCFLQGGHQGGRDGGKARDLALMHGVIPKACMAQIQGAAGIGAESDGTVRHEKDSLCYGRQKPDIFEFKMQNSIFI